MSQSRFEQTLLRSGHRDAPTPARRAASRTALLQAAGFAAASATASTASAATTTTAATTATATAAKTLGLTKLVLLTLLGLGGIGAVAMTVQARHDAPIAVGTAVPMPPRPTTAMTAAPRAEVEPASISVNALPSAPASDAPTSAPSVDPLAAEAQLLEAARGCLAKGDYACASTRLREHDAKFARGALVDEAMLLAIDVAHARGDRAGARHAAERLLVLGATGTYAARARAVLADEEKTP